MNNTTEQQQMKNPLGQNDASEAEKAQVQIPKALAEKIRNRLSKTDFKSVDDYVSYVVEQVLVELEGGDSRQAGSDSAFSKEDQESVEQRLRDLGYL